MLPETPKSEIPCRGLGA
ncbi:hypothetical protein AYI68_g6178, partial [Smittium mucronatum]